MRSVLSVEITDEGKYWLGEPFRVEYFFRASGVRGQASELEGACALSDTDPCGLGASAGRLGSLSSIEFGRNTGVIIDAIWNFRDEN